MMDDRYKYLKPALAEIAGRGEVCFNRTNSGMATIEYAARTVEKKVCCPFMSYMLPT
jgi:hypothetical protein